MAYIVVSSLDMKEFIALVNYMISNGWACQGGVAIGADTMLYQAMVREIA